ncbi:hypothetical protein TrLO_g7807 [Triparma laevis f. longispina]|uniref:MTHFR SAM-binding regulatory domain-containing protein n=1 Tax=Triparma laevis f. longispina TaxID=1714387 RepID=A0A9W7DQI6_9STRA|nr:hypothetical protein TrLO_g7807 [Triparma laevis f. longispina]
MKIIDKILKIRTDRLEATNPPSRSTSSNSVSSAVSSVHDHEQGTTTDHVVDGLSNLPTPPTPPLTTPCASSSPYFSFEFFPPKTEAGLDNLYERIDRMKDLEPLFIDVTWGAGGRTERETLSIASYAQQYCGLDVLMHLTCTGLSRGAIKAALETAKDAGVHNILALRGDAGKGQSMWTPHPDGFKNATELVLFIKQTYGNHFGIAVAGHPEGHIDGPGVESDLNYLKEKIDAGADFIVTQFFYDTDVFIGYVEKCRGIGITCPIIPGVMAIQSYPSFLRMTQFCKTKVSSNITEMLEAVKDDDEAVKTKGVEIAVDMCQKLLREGYCDGVHFYTLNLERSVRRILEKLESVDPDDHHYSSKTQRQLPWRPSTLETRKKEEVRPINWANRPKSYMKRTEDWDEFPNGRWGDARSPAFGELSDSHFYRFTLGNVEDRKAMLGENPTMLQDVYDVFGDYILGKIPLLPWCEQSLQPESFTIQEELAALNRKGFLTINSQPAVNGVPSDDQVFGWGGKGGYCYQKAYVECFVSPENFAKLLESAEKRDSLNLYGLNSKGEVKIGQEGGGVTALTWGVFPNREVLQPTVFDPEIFAHTWSEEAFSLWQTMWLSLYDEESEAYELLEEIHDTFYLVAIVDNEFQKDDNLWKLLLELSHD